MTISTDWLALGISLVALVASVFALLQTARYRRGDRSVYARRLTGILGAKIESILERAEKSKRDWLAVLNVTSSIHSGQRIEIENKLNQAREDAESLRNRLATASENLSNASNAELDLRLAELHALDTEVDRVVSQVQGSENRRQEKLERHQSNLDSFRRQ
ncbi:hypothetical protein [Defluviimonas salinarum]|uniref:DNA recombination protein RmuC n=1 Tax=Defluviimonas salinarum TaxID=2992147 RepID=A0ABT3IXW1_9RHOB|nr:hypothetical protein [Defluviimonas salinarum]MCW3780275.1 hypothetical protein [Defluviimonas salinarum]